MRWRSLFVAALLASPAFGYSSLPMTTRIDAVTATTAPGKLNNGIAHVMEQRANRLALAPADVKRGITLGGMGGVATNMARGVGAIAATGTIISFGVLLYDVIRPASGDLLTPGAALPPAYVDTLAPDARSPLSYTRSNAGALVTVGGMRFAKNPAYSVLMPKQDGRIEPVLTSGAQPGSGLSFGPWDCEASSVRALAHCIGHKIYAPTVELLRDVNGNPVRWGVSELRGGFGGSENLRITFTRASYRNAQGQLVQAVTTQYVGFNVGVNGTQSSTWCARPDDKDELNRPYRAGYGYRGTCFIEHPALDEYVEPAEYTFPNKLPQDWQNSPLNPAELAKLINELWRQAALVPGYGGMPYSATDPITADDIEAAFGSRPDLRPTIGDLVSPVSPGAVARANIPAVSLPDNRGLTTTDPRYQPDPGTQLVTTPGTTPGTTTTATLDLGPDPGVGPPAADTTTPSMIIDPWFDWFPTVSWPSGGQCPVASFDALNETFTTQAICDFAEQQRAIFSAAFAVLWVMVAAGVVLRA